MTANLLLSQAVSVFLIARQADSYSPATIAQYRWALERLASTAGEKRIEDVTTDDLRQFLAYLQIDYKPTRPSGNTSPLGSASIFAAWKAVRAFYKWACPEFGIQNPSAKIPPPRHASPVIVPFTQDDIKLLLKACDKSKQAATNGRKSFTMSRYTAARDRAIVLMLLDTGLRVSELCRLTVGDCNLQTGEAIVRPVGAGIKSRPRVVPLGAASRKAVALYRARQGGDDKTPLFEKDEGGVMDRGNVLHMLVALGKRAGVSDCHPHRFRHTFAIQYLRNGGDVFSLQRILGHSSLEMVRHYLALANSDDVAAHRQASPVDRWRL